MNWCIFEYCEKEDLYLKYKIWSDGLDNNQINLDAAFIVNGVIINGNGL